MDDRLIQARAERIRRIGLVPGSRVRFSRDFLRDTGCHTGWEPFATGTINSFEQWGNYRLAHITWDDGTERSVAEGNLALDNNRRETETTEWAVAKRL